MLPLVACGMFPYNPEVELYCRQKFPDEFPRVVYIIFPAAYFEPQTSAVKSDEKRVQNQAKLHQIRQNSA
jgi:hypothetical protein